MKIFVNPAFRQQEGDRVLYEYEEVVALEVTDDSLYAEYRVEVSDEEVEEIEGKIAKRLTKELNDLCDLKSKGAKAVIAGMGVSVEQMEEYEMVAKAVEREDVDWFADEASVLGSTAQEEFDKAKEAKQGYTFAYEAFKKLIRLYRRYLVEKIKLREFSLVREKLKLGEEIGVGLEGSPMEILTQSKEQVMKIVGVEDGIK